jgi:hypothetical protein
MKNSRIQRAEIHVQILPTVMLIARLKDPQLIPLHSTSRVRDLILHPRTLSHYIGITTRGIDLRQAGQLGDHRLDPVARSPTRRQFLEGSEILALGPPLPEPRPRRDVVDVRLDVRGDVVLAAGEVRVAGAGVRVDVVGGVEEGFGFGGGGVELDPLKMYK